MILIDTNVLLDIATADPIWFDWSSTHLSIAEKSDTLAINPVIHTELVPAYSKIEDLDHILVPVDRFERLNLPYAAAPAAARAFAAYRREGGTKTAPLPDFFIGAHAEAAGLTLLTRDANRYRTYFPDVTLICPV